MKDTTELDSLRPDEANKSVYGYPTCVVMAMTQKPMLAEFQLGKKKKKVGQ